MTGRHAGAGQISRRVAHRGPWWRRAAYWTVRTLAVIFFAVPVNLALWAGRIGERADWHITHRLTRIEDWAWPGLYVPRGEVAAGADQSG